jgi:hypothetical protein
MQGKSRSSPYVCATRRFRCLKLTWLSGCGMQVLRPGMNYGCYAVDEASRYKEIANTSRSVFLPSQLPEMEGQDPAPLRPGDGTGPGLRPPLGPQTCGQWDSRFAWPEGIGRNQTKDFPGNTDEHGKREKKSQEQPLLFVWGVTSRNGTFILLFSLPKWVLGRSATGDKD